MARIRKGLTPTAAVSWPRPEYDVGLPTILLQAPRASKPRGRKAKRPRGPASLKRPAAAAQRPAEQEDDAHTESEEDPFSFQQFGLDGAGDEAQ